MKKFNLFFMSFSQNIFSSIIITVILSTVLIFGQDIIGQYRYITYSKYIMDNQYITNSDYFMLDLQNLPVNVEEMYKFTYSVRDAISEFDGVRGIAYSEKGICKYNGIKLNTELYTDDMADAFSKNLNQGCWFKDAKASDIPNVVLSGPLFENVSVGNDITITLLGNKYDKQERSFSQKVHVIGKISYPWYNVNYSSSGDDITMDEFMIQSNDVIFDGEDENTVKILDEYSTYSSLGYSYFVLYDDNCKEDRKQKVRDYYNTIGTYDTYDDLLEATDNKIKNELMKKLITPLFLLVVATIMLISISTLNTYKKLKDHSIYYLCGCSRRRSFLYLAAEISVSVIIAVAISLGYVIFMMEKIKTCTMGYDCLIIDYYNILISLGYAVITLAVTLIIPYAVYKKNTPIEIYRRNHND